MPLPTRVLVADDLHLELLDPTKHARPFAALVDAAGATTTRWLPHLLDVRDVDTANRYLDRRVSWFDGGTSAEWGVMEDGELVGMAWLVDIQEINDAADIGYWLAPRARGRGIATRVTERLLETAFGKLGLHRVSIRCIAANAASRAIPERLGFTLEGTIREAWKVHGTHVDHVIYGMLAHEWRSYGEARPNPTLK